MHEGALGMLSKVSLWERLGRAHGLAGSSGAKWWRLLLAALAAAVAVLLGAGTASATTAPNLQTRVGASTLVGQVAIGVHESVSAGQRWGNAPPRAETVVATGVAAKTPGLKSLASEVREAGMHPAARNNRTIAVGIDADGGLFAGSSNGFDAGQRAALERLGITRVPGSGALHAEEELLRGVPTLQRVGTSVRAPCGASEHNCALQLIERGVGVE